MLNIKKLSIAIVAAIFIIALAPLLSSQIPEPLGCCCDPTSKLAYNPPWADYTAAQCQAPHTTFIEVIGDDYWTKTCQDVCGSMAEVITPEPSTGCGPTADKEGPKNLRATVSQGTPEIRLEWDIACQPVSYNIYRCAGASCKTLSTVAYNKFFYDSDAAQSKWLPFDAQTSPIKWNTDYDYTVGAVFAPPTGEKNSTPIKFRKNAGSIECWGKSTNERFCISEYFYTGNYRVKDYLKKFGYGASGPFPEEQLEFSNKVKEVFLNTIDRGGVCDSNNILTKDAMCPAGKVCTPNGCGITECNVLNGVLGLNVTNSSCEFDLATNSPKYCFFDRSPYIFDKCYTCNPQMNCYDYKSKSACLKDNCDVVKAGSCSWTSLYDPGLGIGVCKDTGNSQCRLCTDDGTDVAENINAWNKIFDVCTSAKSDALATTGNNCFYNEGNPQDCLTLTCKGGYTLQPDCGSTDVVLNSDNSRVLKPNADPCQLKVCQWFGSTNKCRKNADADSDIDCSTDACEKDLFPPVTQITGVFDELTATTNYLKISVSDQDYVDEITRAAHYQTLIQPDAGSQPVSNEIPGIKTYLCIQKNPATDCLNARSIAGNGNFSIIVNRTALRILNDEIKVAQGIVITQKLAAGPNTIKYYSRDSANNLEVVQSVSVTACIGCKVNIESLYVEGARYYPAEKTYYTKSQIPTIIANFTDNVTIEYFLLRNDTAIINSATVQNTTLKANSSYKFNPSTLAETNYTFNFSAYNPKKAYVPSNDPLFPLRFVVDKTSPTLAITPVGTVYSANQELKLQFNEKAIIKTATLAYTTGVGSVNPTSKDIVEDLKSNFTTVDGNKTFTFQYAALAEGANTLSVAAEDYAGNPVAAISTFLVDTTRPLEIRIKTPPYGVSSTKIFDVIIETTKEVVCKYSTAKQTDWQYAIDPNTLDYYNGLFFFKNAAALDMTAPTTQHTLFNFNELANDDPYTKIRLYVKCTNQNGPSQEFNLWVDNSKPVVTLIADPPKIVERTPPANKLQTTLRVNTTKEAFCNYSNGTGWKTFNNFDGSPRADYFETVIVEEGISQKTYSAYCIPVVDYNLPTAQQRNTTEQITVAITLGDPLEINCTQCPSYWSSFENSITFLTNKGVQCAYSGTNTLVDTTSGTIHSPLLNVAPQTISKTITINCVGQTKPYLYNFTVDTSHPNMTFVDDSSDLEQNREYSQFTDRLKIAWNGTDSQSGIAKYLFKLHENNSPTNLDDLIVNCKANTNCPESIASVALKGAPFYLSQNDLGASLNLTNGKYYFTVWPLNKAELEGDSKDSNGVTIDDSLTPSHCWNGLKDSGETETDCGDGCKGCDEGQNCTTSNDCDAKNCILPAGICKQDTFVPNTTITTRALSSGAAKYLFISIDDQTQINADPAPAVPLREDYLTNSAEESFPEGYETYVCVGAGCTSYAKVTKTPITIIIPGANLSVDGVTLKDSSNNVLKFVDGNNTLRFYSKDSSNNTELVKQVNIVACTDCAGPVLRNVSVNGAREVNNIYYTAAADLTATALFDNSAILTSKSLIKQGAQISLAQNPASGFSSSFALSSAQMAQGNYTLNFSAKGTNNVVAEIIPANYPIVVDRTPPTVTFNLQQGAIIGSTEAFLEINFSEPVVNDTMTAMLNEELVLNCYLYTKLRNVTSSLSKINDKSYRLNIPNLNEGALNLNISAEDYAGNVAKATLNFKVDLPGSRITLESPTYGLSAISPFNIVIRTESNAICKWAPSSQLFGTMEYFNDAGDRVLLHTISSTKLTTEWSECTANKIYIICSDDSNRETPEVCSLTATSKPANITRLYADPNPIPNKNTNNELVSTMTVTTACDSFCRYSELSSKSNSYATMENEFPGFGADPSAANNKPVILPTTTTTNKSYYVGCISPLGGLPDYENVTVGVDLTGDVTINCTTCSDYWNSTTNTIALLTNRNAQCNYVFGTTTVQFTSTGESGNLRNHFATITVSATPAQKSMKINCTAGTRSTVKNYPFTVETTPPDMIYVNDNSSLPGNESEYSYIKDSLKVAWFARDNESGVSRYFYTLKETGAINAIVDCSPEKFNSSCSFATKSKPEDQFNFNNNDKALNLTEGKKYYFTVWPQNPLGMTGSSMDSNGVTINSTKTPAMCSNGAKDTGNETDVDCGGICPQCADNSTCKIDDDCQSGNCILVGLLKVCKPSTCADIKQNANETGVDCGGRCVALGKRCGSGQGCAINDDCTTGLLCTNSQCQAPTQCTNQQIDAGESDVDCGGSCPTKCASGESCSSATDCVAGLYCNSGHCASTTDATDSDGDTIPNDQDKCAGTPKGERVDKNGCSVSQRDTDGDGMLDSWELKYGFDPEDPSNAGVDIDGDVLTNVQEYNYFKQTGREIDPTKKDTDEDGWTDDEEIKAGTDPTDPNSHPTSAGVKKVGKALLWILIIALIVVAGWIGYKKLLPAFKKDGLPSPSAPGFPALPRFPLIRKHSGVPAHPVQRAEEREKFEAKEAREAPRFEGKDYIPLEDLVERLKRERPTAALIEQLRRARQRQPEAFEKMKAEPGVWQKLKRVEAAKPGEEEIRELKRMKKR